MRIWGCTGHYVQGPDVLKKVRSYVEIYGKKAFYITDSFLEPRIRPLVETGYDDSSQVVMATFNGEISRENINAFLNENQVKDEIDVVVGIGGGKVIDTAKIVARRQKNALIICPTTAATDAPVSAMSILYSPKGEMNEIMIHKKNPDLVLVDSRVILDAPIRFLVSGLGDAMSTYYEGISNEKTGHGNYVWCDSENGTSTIAGRAIARTCLDTIYQDGKRALIAASKGELTSQFENVLEANILLSGIGFENVGCSIAHAIGNAFTAIPEGEKMMHGERVGFGTLCLLVAEKYSQKEIEKAYSFCISTGLPVTLEELGIPDTDQALQRIAQASLTAESWQATVYEATKESIVQLIRTASALGEYYKKSLQISEILQH